MKTCRPFTVLAIVALLVAAAQAKFVVTPDKPDGVYNLGDDVRWKIEWRGDGAAPASADFAIRAGGLTEVVKGTLPSLPGTVGTKFTKPGTLFLEVKAAGQRGVGAAIAAADQIKPSSPRPDDFDAFWDAKIKALGAIAPNPQLEAVDVGNPRIDYSKITLDNINGSKIRGQLARPKQGDKLPALLIVQWAGVYPLDRNWITGHADGGWLVLNISAHDLPIDQPPEFYQQQEQPGGPVHNYPSIGNDDRDASYFLRMYLSCYRAAEYLATRADWDGKTLVVTGGSQGGQQTLVTAGLHPKISAAMANVPAGCDMLGPVVGRQGGWPMWYGNVGDKDPKKVREASRYFDVVNFAPRIKCPVLIGVGLLDDVCPPAGIYAAANLIPSPKELVLLPRGGHQSEDGSHDAYDKRLWREWLPALREGKPPPVVATAAAAGAATRDGGTNVIGAYAKLEASFELPDLKGNPFDFTENDVKVTFTGPDGAKLTLPAFFDGGTTWRVRHTPTVAGRHTMTSVTLNGQPVGVNAPVEFPTGDANRGFVRIDPKNKMRFVLDDGSPYYPVGYNLAWRHGGRPPMPPLTESLKRMGSSGVNWTRIWMNHWDSKNLDWAHEDLPNPPLGQLLLPTAKLWDEIVDAAEQNGVRVQLVLQHHGQYSTKANPNWEDHPWSKANGGWLERPEQFFSDPKAIALTKAKYRYIIARWGYSPAVMAWELFNEIEYTDAFDKALPAVAAWHAEMAKFLREHDVYDHLVTTSGRVWEPSIWPAMDYYQSHVYPPDLISAIASLDAEKLDRAYFYGEVGGSISGEQVNPGDAIHRSLWASLMSGSSGAAQYWYWYVVEPQNLDFHYTAAQRFIKESDVLKHTNLKPLDVSSTTPNRAALRFGPGTGWAPAKQTTFTVRPSGFVEGLGGMSSYLQGNHPLNRKMFPFAVFDVDYAEPGTFTVSVDERTEDGVRLEATLDGQPVGALVLGPPPPAAPRVFDENRPPRKTIEVDASLELRVPAGKHTLRFENTGADWVRIRQIALTPYTSELAVLAKGTSEFAVMWVSRRQQEGTQPVTGSVSLPGMSAGTYRVVWWDTYKGERLREQTASADASGGLTLDTPPVARDVAAWVARSGG